MDRDFFMLTLKALEHPQGLEVINAVRQFRQEVQADAEPDPVLKVEAMNIVKNRGVRTPQHVNHMTDTELRTFISQHST